MSDVTKNSRLFAVTVPRCCLLRVLETVFSTHRHPAHPVSVPIRHPSDKSSVVTSFETDIYIPGTRKYNKKPSTYAVYSCVWRPGCFPGTWRRGSWHLQVASLHLQSIMDLCPLHITFFFFLPGASVAGGVCRPRSEAPCIYKTDLSIAQTTPQSSSYVFVHW